MSNAAHSREGHGASPWIKGHKVGQKRALRRQDVRKIRGRLRAEGHKRDLALAAGSEAQVDHTEHAALIGAGFTDATHNCTFDYYEKIAIRPVHAFSLFLPESCPNNRDHRKCQPNAADHCGGIVPRLVGQIG
jgi:hypothetical protein